jgi:hypothetical protein
VVLLGSLCEAAEEEGHPVQGYGWGVPVVQTPCDHQRKAVVLQIEIDSIEHYGYHPSVSLVVAGAAEAQH